MTFIGLVDFDKRYPIRYHIGGFVGRVKRGGYIFEFWVGDHPPRHVHVLKDGKLIARVELDERLTLMEGKISRRVRKIIKALVGEGILR